ncbi:MAG: fluoride efflux transporter CrcB [Bacteroidota bacterium]
MNFVCVFIGGGLGSICRYGIALLLRPYTDQFPYATLMANIVSCVILGWLFAYSQRVGLSSNATLLLMTGFCGGFSTFSTFSLETFTLFTSGQSLAAFANVVGNLVICLGAIWLGIKLSV